MRWPRRAYLFAGFRLDPDVELISKPFTYESLGRKIRALLDNKPN
jgi:hypothetical protein